MCSTREESALSDRQESQIDATDNIFLWQWTPDTRIGTIGAIITYDEIFFRIERNIFGISCIFVNDIRLGERNCISGGGGNGDDAMINRDCFVRKPDNALDIENGRIARVAEDNDITALGRTEVIEEFIHDEIIQILEGWMHRCAVNDKRRDHEDADRDDHDDNKERECEKILQKTLSSILHACIVRFASSRASRRRVIAGGAASPRAALCYYMRMTLVIVGLGNPGKEYAKTRHNAGRSAVEIVAKNENFDDFVFNKTAHALVSKGAVAGKDAIVILPETFVNLSGKAVSAFVKSPKAAKNLLVIHDDLDLPFGTIKMVFGRGSGGHKGVESIMRAVKTQEFARIRIGISAAGKKHRAKKVSGEEKVIKHVIGKWKPAEEAALKKVLKKVAETVHLFATEGIESATQFANTR